jgi:hypothetical protein
LERDVSNIYLDFVPFIVCPWLVVDLALGH